MFRHPWYLKLCALLTFILTLGTCTTRPPKGSGIPSTHKEAEEKILVDDGEGSQPCYSPAGDRLLFVSAKRYSHSQPQVYEKEFATGTEKRLTFQNGTLLSPRYHPREPWVIYASTTDELKESPPLLNPTTEPSKLPQALQEPAEVYIHSLDGLEITRVTNRAGYDGEPQFSPDGKTLYWTKALKDRTQIVQLTRSTKATRTLTGLGTNPADYVPARNGKASAWIDWDETFGISKLMLKAGAEKPVEINSEHLVTKSDLTFSPDSQFLAWSQFNALNQHWEIWVYDIAGKCARMWLGSDSADRRHPAFSPDRKEIAYTLIRSGRSRIAQLPFEPRTGPCSPSD